MGLIAKTERQGTLKCGIQATRHYFWVGKSRAEDVATIPQIEAERRASVSLGI